MVPLDYLNALRLAEIERVAPLLPPGCRVLEIGAGTGQQSLALRRRGFDVAAVDLPGSTYAQDRVFPILDYDGKRLPYTDASFDAVFSSNMLEHIRDLSALYAEIRRVLKPDGQCVHVLPTHFWRFWTIMSSFPAAVCALGAAIRRSISSGPVDTPTIGEAWRHAIGAAAQAVMQPRHGERGIGLAELWLFHPRWWRRHFLQNEFEILRDEPMGLFYTGNVLCGSRLTLQRRAVLAKFLGSSCHLFHLKRTDVLA